MGINAALFSGPKCYFFAGDRYIRVTRGDTGAGTVDAGYPKAISNWGWPSGFGRDGIDAALYSGPKTYFFDGDRYIRVTRGDTGAGTVDAGYPKAISNWGWPSGFGAQGIDGALYSGAKTYFFDGDRYIRVTRGNTGAGTVDAGYPKAISNWGWPSGFGRDGIDAALNSGTKTYFFDGNQYIRVTRGDTGAGTVDAGYPKDISTWGWPAGFGTREFVTIHFKSLLPVTSTIQSFMDTQFTEMRSLYSGSNIDVRRGATEDLSGNANLADLVALDVGGCAGVPTTEQITLFGNRNNVGRGEMVVYVVQSLVGSSGANLVGCASHPAGQPGAAVVRTSAPWLLAHEIGHVLGLSHVPNTPPSNSDFLMWPNTGWTHTPPDVSNGETSRMLGSNLSHAF